jgi:ABC-2 type transport system permease protein
VNPARVWAFARYEIRRASARKKVLVLVVMTVLVGVLPIVIIRSVGGLASPVVASNSTSASSGGSLLTPPDYPYIWVIGIFLVQGFFLPFTALLIAAGSMSEEYEQGTAELLLSKPVTRNDYFAGKFIGGFILITAVILLNATLSVTTALFTFGNQAGLGVLPPVVLAQIYSALVFFSLAFMLGELFRRSTLSYITASATFLISEIAGTILRIVYTLTGDAFYQHINVYLPTTPVSSLPLQIGQPSLPAGAKYILSIIGTGATETSLALSVGLIALYAVCATTIAVLYFNRVDVSKRVA